MSISRRGFLEKSALASSFYIVPRHVLGGKGFLAPSDKLLVAGIGVGGKGKSDLKKFTATVPPERPLMRSCRVLLLAGKFCPGPAFSPKSYSVLSM